MIVGVAIRNDVITIKLPKPNRHFDCFHYLDSFGIDFRKTDIGAKSKDQGFYTHTGKYLDRVEAFKYVKRIKQPVIDEPLPARGGLCSEDLW